ncbi:uncharacterized protein LOC113235410 [Hyposmocoma kahamanoa]|uniref:uncharacterized protein LOC113235410 n=1 Tax=Hyposmocoma kahamanoa TaxID=1477025 RepID=UPI000E6D87CB|nr:uncharacterized protein LOC113235410 [Hyposmocoma kahamanoa]
MSQQVKCKGIRARIGAATRYRYLFLLATVCGSAFLLLSMHHGGELLLLAREPLATAWHHHYDLLDDDAFTINTEGCTIPGMQPLDDTIKKYVIPPSSLKACHETNFSLLHNNATHIWIKNEYLEYFRNPIGDVNLTCCYRGFYRPSSIADIYSKKVDDRVKYKSCIYFVDSIEVVNEYVQVTCEYNFRSIYEQYFLFAPKKPLMTNGDNFVEINQNKSYNIIIMGMDAISRLNFHRTMPKTLAFLQKREAIELKGYNKVGDNTFPNLAPVLFGIKVTDLKRTCWPRESSTFDNCPFIWEWYKDAGYYTAFGEDSAFLGTFNFQKFGFSGTPTDYYIRTFVHEAEVHTGNNKDFNTFICMGNKYFYKVLLDYIESLTNTLKDSRLFGFFWEVTMSHDYLNYPVAMDDDYENFLINLDRSEYLNDTILILLSDHGIRWGDIRFTKQGRLEERLPLAYMLLPPTFRENYDLAHNNLKINSQRLTTPFDLHAMLADLVNLDKIKNENIQKLMATSYSHQSSISLFLPIPKNRTCETAGIDDHWCTCHKYHKVPQDSAAALEAAGNLIRHLNYLLRGHEPICAKLKLASILDVTELEAGTPAEHEAGWKEYMVVVRTTPGDGVFEATLRHDHREWKLGGTISRLNLYGEQSHCMHHYQLKLYCYCLDKFGSSNAVRPSYLFK